MNGQQGQVYRARKERKKRIPGKPVHLALGLLEKRLSLRWGCVGSQCARVVPTG